MNKAILKKEVQEFLEASVHREPSEIALQGSPFSDVSPSELATQLSGKRKAYKKLPTWFKTQGIVYPPGVNIEQTSSQATAVYKANLLHGAVLADLSGGLGIDSYYFSKNFQTVYHCEIDTKLSELAAHNLGLLGANNIRFIQGDGIQFLRTSSTLFDWLYIDPSRRSQSGGRVFRLVDCRPDVPSNLDFLLSKTKNLLLKTSPLLDIHAGLSELGEVREIHIVAVKNDVKELLWILGSTPKPIEIKTINFTGGQPQVFKAGLLGNDEVVIGPPASVLYEPNAAIMKSGLFSSLAAAYELRKLHRNTHLFTASKLVEFPGRRFKIIKELPYNRKKIKKVIGSTKANISIRNFPESVASLRKEFKVKEGGDTYLFFTTIRNEERVLLICEKIAS